jgi:thioredoxin-like negative regulator of GroEL
VSRDKPRISARAALVVLILAALAAAGGITVFLLLRQPPMADASFETLLESVDASISQGYLGTAADALSSARGIPRGEADQLRLLKRAFEIGRSGGDYSLLASLGARARAINGRSSRIAAIAAYADLRTGRIAEANRIVGRGAPAGLDSLRGETLLREGAPWKGSDELTREILALEASADPSAYSRAALRADEKRLSLDASILAMRQGMLSEAAGLVRSELAESRFDEPAGLVLYDAGALSEAALRLRRRFSASPSPAPIGLVMADIAAESGDTAAAQAWLLRSLPLAPSVSWTPYADLALFALQRGDFTGAARRLEDGLAFFPQSRELKLMRARVAADSGDTSAAEAMLAALLRERPADSEAALLLLSLQAPAMSPEALRGRLWKLFDAAPTDPVVFGSLASSLVAARDWDGMKIAVEQLQAAGGAPDARSLMLQGFAAAMRDDDRGARDAFRRADLMAKDGTARFDTALLLLHGGNARAARDELETAAAEIQDTAAPADRARLLSRVETLRGAAMMLDGDPSGASLALARARQLDPANLRASLLQHKLEAGDQ